MEIIGACIPAILLTSSNSFFYTFGKHILNKISTWFLKDILVKNVLLRQW